MQSDLIHTGDRFGMCTTCNVPVHMTADVPDDYRHPHLDGSDPGEIRVVSTVVMAGGERREHSNVV